MDVKISCCHALPLIIIFSSLVFFCDYYCYHDCYYFYLFLIPFLFSSISISVSHFFSISSFFPIVIVNISILIISILRFSLGDFLYEQKHGLTIICDSWSVHATQLQHTKASTTSSGSSVVEADAGRCIPRQETQGLGHQEMVI